MDIEEAKDILANAIDDYVIGDYCCEICEEEEICKETDCPFHKAIEIVLQELFKLQARVDRLKVELEKKEAVINEMAKEIADITGSCPYDKYDYGLDCSLRCEEGIEAECWIEYFTKKVEGK